MQLTTEQFLLIVKTYHKTNEIQQEVGSGVKIKIFVNFHSDKFFSGPSSLKSANTKFAIIMEKSCY